MSEKSTLLDKKDQAEGTKPSPDAKPAQHIQVAHGDYHNTNPYTLSQYNKNFRSICYNIACFCFEILFTTFFRKIDHKGVNNLKELLPKNKNDPQDAIILMCGPHSNQFVDGGIVMQMTQKLTGLQSCSCIAASSFKQIVVGTFSRMTGGIPVPRQQDYVKPVKGYVLESISENVVLLKPIEDNKRDLKDIVDLMTKGMIGIKSNGNAIIKSFKKSETGNNCYEVEISKPFKKEIEGDVQFGYAPRIDHSVLFDSVFKHLLTGGTLSIFPEGGSHDRPNMLPIKPGVAIMALGTVCGGDKTKNVTIVPVGLNYFNRDKFRSRAVIEYGQPVVVDYENWGKLYEKDSFAAVEKLMTVLKKSLYAVTVNTEDYETLQVIQACRRLLYTNHTEKISYNVVINRMLIKGYEHFQDDERIVEAKRKVLQYNKNLYEIGVRDHQVDLLQSLSPLRAVKLLLNRTIRIMIMAFLAFPGFVLFSPVFVTAHYYSIMKAKEGLSKSVVKIKGNDLLATWKLVVALGLAPLLYVLYSIIMIKFDLFPIVTQFTSSVIIKFIVAYSFLVSITYTALRAGETGVDLMKSLKPLVVSLIYPQKKLYNLRMEREELQEELQDLCDTLGPEIWPNYNEMKDELKKKLEDDSNDYDNKLSSRSPSRSRSRSRSRRRNDFYGGQVLFATSGEDLSDEPRGRKRENSLGSIGSMLGFGKIKDNLSDDSSDGEFEIIDDVLKNPNAGASTATSKLNKDNQSDVSNLLHERMKDKRQQK